MKLATASINLLASIHLYFDAGPPILCYSPASPNPNGCSDLNSPIILVLHYIILSIAGNGQSTQIRSEESC